MSRPLTPREADWVRCVIETFTARQERKSDERIRQSVMAKLADISAAKSTKQPISTTPEPCEQHGRVWCDCDK
jgi:hypothetical protein